MKVLLKLPFLVILMAISAVSMLVPMAHAIRIGDFFTARVFLHSGLLILLLTALIGLALLNRPPARTAHTQLIHLLAAFLVLPVFLGIPLLFLHTSASAFDIYFEMLSCLTTTGASLFDDASRLNEPTHLWRALVGWMGGFLMLLSAVAIFAPMNLGGFEVYAIKPAVNPSRSISQIRAADVSERLASFSWRMAPVYLAATAVLALALTLLGERPFIAAVLAMATLSTSGITSTGDSGRMMVGYGGEALIFIFMIFAVSRVLLPTDRTLPKLRTIWQDHEFKLALAFVTTLPMLLFLRHWLGALDLSEQKDIPEALSAAWGSVFTVLSFLTTTGFVSTSWHDSQLWSGLESTRIALLGLSVMGGGIATTAGGIKLLRVYALYKHGARELQKLSFPRSVAGAGGAARHIRREGAYVAWLFFMLFAITTALVMLALGLSGLTFEESLAFGTSALSTTGPLAAAVLENGAEYGALNIWAKVILCVGMVLGRFETLAIIALLNPEFWRR